MVLQDTLPGCDHLPYFASGSSGNASLLELDRTDGGVDRYLFDAGISHALDELFGGTRSWVG